MAGSTIITEAGSASAWYVSAWALPTELCCIFFNAGKTTQQHLSGKRLFSADSWSEPWEMWEVLLSQRGSVCGDPTTQNLVCRPECASSQSFLEAQNLPPDADPLLQNLHFNQVPAWLEPTIMFEKHWAERLSAGRLWPCSNLMPWVSQGSLVPRRMA